MVVGPAVSPLAILAVHVASVSTAKIKLNITARNLHMLVHKISCHSESLTGIWLSCRTSLLRFWRTSTLRAMRYTVKAAARATGVSESRLRTWERRYGIPKPARSETGRRLYDDGDLRVIRRMAALVGAGLPAAQAAEAAR
ncbi:MAG: MerR family transcriptional regulator, partial [Chloroflexi bacterium]|nr:MerR family transcriptional regulator [Chloroflexota bacterium]